MPDLFRYDRGELARSVKTREGFLLVEGYIAKPGVLQYIRSDGTIQRELVTEKTLHDPASLATLGRKPVTLEHPEGKVDPDNVAELAVGDVDGEIEIVQGGFVKVRLAVRRRDALDAIERGGTLELSPGYGITIDETSGVHPVFGEYDAIQTSRSYNHVALTAIGRGGTSIRLRADSAFDTRLQGGIMDPKILTALVAALTTAGVRFDSKDIAKADADGIASHIGALADAFATARDALVAATSKKDQEGVEGAEEDEENTDEEEAAEEMEEKADSKRIAWHRTRTDLESRADALGLGLKKTDTLSNNTLRRAVVLATRTDAKTDGSVDYYRAAFDMLPKADTNRADAWSRIKAPGKTEEARHDADPSASWSQTIADQFAARHGDA